MQLFRSVLPSKGIFRRSRVGPSTIFLGASPQTPISFPFLFCANTKYFWLEFETTMPFFSTKLVVARLALHHGQVELASLSPMKLMIFCLVPWHLMNLGRELYMELQCLSINQIGTCKLYEESSVSEKHFCCNYFLSILLSHYRSPFNRARSDNPPTLY